MMIGVDHIDEPALTKPGPDAITAIPKKVAVVDDELVGMTYSHLDSDCVALFEDRNSPEFTELWDIARYIKGYADIEKEDPIKIREYFASDDLVTEVILSKYFHDSATIILKGPLTNFLDRAAKIQTLRGHLEKAFPKPEFELTFYGERPNTSELVTCDLLVLDLVLTKSTSAVDEAVEYLKNLGNDAGSEALPPIILMSSHQELLVHKEKFSTKSNISAAGLLILPKAEVAAEAFAAQGLKLTYQQLSMQRNVAFRMRAFMLSWTTALEDARDKAATTLWNLDAAAMQQIHYTAFNDNDPYDEHLNELIAREHLWHVESNPSVGKAIDALDKCFLEQFDGGASPSIQHRFIAPFVEPENCRALLSHFTWAGWDMPTSFIEMNAEVATRNFNKFVPFGAMLVGNDFAPNAECLVHITQQCDLNSASRDPTTVQTAVFAVVQAIEVEPHKVPTHATQDLVARSLQVNGKEYDFKLLKGRLLALPIPDFLKYALANGLHVCGRLRHDIANHFMQATVNHMIRPASLTMVRTEVIDAKLFLHGSKFPKGQSGFLDSSTEKGKIVQVTREGTVCNFQNEESIRIALWVQAELKAHYEIENIDANALCSTLRVGCNEGELVSNIDFRVLNCVDLKDAWKAIKSLKDANDRINLVMVTDK